MVTRRAFIAGSGTALSAALLPALGGADEAVWLGMSQQELDDAYDQSVWAPNRAFVRQVRAQRIAAARARLGDPAIHAYGDAAEENLLLYRTDRDHAPVHVFIHGGAWRVTTAEDYPTEAEPLVAAGAHVVMPNFASVTGNGVPLTVLCRQVRDAVAWAYRNAAQFGGDPDRIYVSGHSSGGHLCGVVLTTDWAGDYDLPDDTIKGGLCISGMFDLEPVRLSKRDDYLQLTDAEEQAFSPQRHIDHLHAPLIVAYGTEETPEFQRQSRDFAAAVAATGKPVELLVVEGTNHFEILEQFNNPFGVVGRAAFSQMQLAPMRQPAD